MALFRKEFKGAAAPTTLTGFVADSGNSFTLDNAAGYPTGSIGPFQLTFNRGGSNEETVLFSSRSGNVCTVAVGGRGYDGTTPADHQPNETVEHTYAGVDADDTNAHIYDTSRDDHPQYLTSGRHDTYARHGAGVVSHAQIDDLDLDTHPHYLTNARHDTPSRHGPTSVDHNSIGNLTVGDPHTQYVLKTGFNSLWTARLTAEFPAVFDTRFASSFPGAFDTRFATAHVLASHVLGTNIADQPSIWVGARPAHLNGRTIYGTADDRYETSDGTTWVRSGWGSSTGRTGGSWRRNANQTIASASATAITWDNEDTDSDNFLTPSSDTITIPSGLGGLYVMAASGPWSAVVAAFNHVDIQIYNGVTLRRVIRGHGISGTDFWSVNSGIVPLVAGETIKIVLRQDSGSNRAITGFVDVYRVGA